MVQRLSLFAGGGDLVPQVLEAVSAAGWEIQVLNLIGRNDLSQWNAKPANLSNPLAILMQLRAFKPSTICMVGGLTISDKQREGLFSFLTSNTRKTKSTGDTGMSKLITALEFTTGAKVIGVHEIVPELRAPLGLIAGPAISKNTRIDCINAQLVAQKVGDLDIGQAVVCTGERIIAVEDIAGTDALISRVGQFVKQGMTGNGSDPLILAKAKKPNQPSTADLPAIGPDTITQAHQAGITVICVEANNSLLIQKSKLIDQAKQLGISVFGVSNANNQGENEIQTNN